jgi:hypothetical protein
MTPRPLLARLSFTAFALALAAAAPALAQDDAQSMIQRAKASAQKQRSIEQKPAAAAGACAAPNANLAGRTDYFDAKGVFLRGSKSGAPEDAVVLLFGKGRGLFDEAVSRPCPAGQVPDDQALRKLGQAYAIEEFIRFDSAKNRVKLANGLISEMRTQLYRGADGVVHIGREKIVSGNATEVSDDDHNVGGTGYENQGPEKSVGRLHTHPNSDSHEMLGIPRHHPSDQDVSHVNDSGYSDVVVSPLYVYLINNKNAGALVFARHDTFGDNPVKAFVKKEAELDEYYDKHKSWPPGTNWDEYKKSNPWSQ